jgi:hypothetical protein
VKSFTSGFMAASVWCALGLFSSFCEAPPFAPGSSAIKVSEEIVLMSPGDHGGIRRGRPAVAVGTNCYLVVWQEGWNGDRGKSRIYALRVSLDGKAIDPKPLEVAPAIAGVQENPRVAFFGGKYLVVWQDLRNGKDDDILAARISSDGNVLDAEPMVIAGGPRTQTMPDIAADDDGFMVVWHAFPGDDFQAKVYARRVRANGMLSTINLLMVGATPRIAWNGNEHLVVYYKAGSPGAGTAMGQMANWQRMDTAMNLLPSKRSGMITGDVPLQTPLQCSIGALPEENGWIIVRHGGVPDYWGRTNAFQRAYRVTVDGETDTPDERTSQGWNLAAVLDTSVGKKSYPAVGAFVPDIWPYGRSAVASDGQYGLVVWQRFHTGDATGMALINGDIRASRVDGWRPMDGDGGLPVAETPADELDPELAGNGAGKFLCVYEKDVEGRSSIAARTIQTR